ALRAHFGSPAGGPSGPDLLRRTEGSVWLVLGRRGTGPSGRARPPGPFLCTTFESKAREVFAARQKPRSVACRPDSPPVLRAAARSEDALPCAHGRATQRANRGRPDRRALAAPAAARSRR